MAPLKFPSQVMLWISKALQSPQASNLFTWQRQPRMIVSGLTACPLEGDVVSTLVEMLSMFKHSSPLVAWH